MCPLEICAPRTKPHRRNGPLFLQAARREARRRLARRLARARGATTSQVGIRGYPGEPGNCGKRRPPLRHNLEERMPQAGMALIAAVHHGRRERGEVLGHDGLVHGSAGFSSSRSGRGFCPADASASSQGGVYHHDTNPTRPDGGAGMFKRDPRAADE